MLSDKVYTPHQHCFFGHALELNGLCIRRHFKCMVIEGGARRRQHGGVGGGRGRSTWQRVHWHPVRPWRFGERLLGSWWKAGADKDLTQARDREVIFLHVWHGDRGVLLSKRWMWWVEERRGSGEGWSIFRLHGRGGALWKVNVGRLRAGLEWRAGWSAD